MAYAGSLNLVAPAANRIWQRDVRSGNPAGNWLQVTGQGWGTIALAISPSATSTLIEYRVRDASAPNATPLLDWTPCAGAFSPGPSVLSMTLAARSGWSLVDLRAGGDNASITSTGALGMGEVIAASGQSLASNFWSTIATGDTATFAGCGVLPSPYGVCLAGWDGGPAPSSTTAWAAPRDASTYNSTFAAEFLRLAVAATGVNCALVGYAWSGEPISSWRSDGSGPKNVWASLVATLDSALGQTGKFGTFIWAHGHNDARIAQAGVDGDQLSADRYFSALAPLISAVAARYPAATFSKIVSSVPAIGANWITTTPKYVPSFIEQIRSAHLRYVKSDGSAAGHVDGLDVPLWSDQTHPSQIGNVTFARHFFRAFMRGIGSGEYQAGDSGPSLSTVASRAPGSNQVILRVTHDGGTALTCTAGPTGAATQFQAFRSGSTSQADQVVVQSIDLSRSNLLVLTLATTPPDNQPLDIWYRLPPDSSAALLPANQIYDNNVSANPADGLTVGRQLAMAPVAVTVPAPAWHRPALLRPGVPMLAAARTIAFAL